MKTIQILHLGIGNVGQELVRRIMKENSRLKAQQGVDLRFIGAYTSKSGIYKARGLRKNDWNNLKKSKHSPFEVLDNIKSPFVLIDTTASNNNHDILLSALKKGGYVVLSNKKPLTSSQKNYQVLMDNGSTRLFYETTVGAGLPVIRTLKTLLETGDKILSITGCFSGTLGLIFSKLEQGSSFSEAVREAKDKGFTEPDPRDDLSGVDVARKILILIRLLGRKMELSDVDLIGLYPNRFNLLSVADFLKELSTIDMEYEKQRKKAKKNGKTLRFIASISSRGCTVRLQEVPLTSDVGMLRGPRASAFSPIVFPLGFDSRKKKAS